MTTPIPLLSHRERAAAKNRDNSGNWISSVENCNRGNYTTVAGYFFANRSMAVS